MSTNYLSPNMSLIIPVPTEEPSPNWGYDLNASLTILDGHNHSPGSGVQVPTSGININADLSFNNANNVTGLRSVRFYDQSAVLALSTDVGCVYISGGNLYFNYNASTPVQITSGNAVSGSTGTITGLPSGTASAAYQSSPGTFVFQQATSTGANIDCASVIVRYPGSYPSPSGNYIAIEAPSSLASGYSITLPSLPAQTNVVTLTSVGVLASITYDAVGTNMTLTGANAIGVSMSSTGANAIGVSMTSTGANAVAASRTRATSASTVAAGGVAISASCGNFSVSSGTLAAVTNLSVTITTSGRPVMLVIVPDGNTNSSSTPSRIGGSGTASTSSGSFAFFRDSTQLNQAQFFASGGSSYGSVVPPSCLTFIDIVAAGTYTYSLQALLASTQLLINYCKLMAYEL